jgi:AraC family transcriptional regulator
MVRPVADLAATAYAAGLRHLPHEHQELQISIVLRGRVAETVHGHTEYAGSLAIVVKDPGVVHADVFGRGGADMLRLSFADATFGALLDDERRSCSWRWLHDPAATAPFLRLAQRSRDGCASLPQEDTDVLELLAALSTRAVVSKGSPPQWLVRVVDELQDHPVGTPDIGALARRAGVHPVYLARCVRRWYGTGLGEMLRLLRVRAAAHELSDGSNTVATVAHRVGFADEAHLCRVFKRATGVTPGRYKRLVGGMGFEQAGPSATGC